MKRSSQQSLLVSWGSVMLAITSENVLHRHLTSDQACFQQPGHTKTSRIIAFESSQTQADPGTVGWRVYVR